MLGFLGTLFLFLLVLSVLVIIHELGHFFVARLFGVRVEEFGIGFPPRATSRMRGNTRYSLNWLPLGGFVKLKGEQGEEKDASDSFASKPIWQRVCILGAGVFMNLVLAATIFAFGFSIGMPQVIDDSANAVGARDIHVQITQVLPGAPAALAGMQPGDRILSLGENAIETVAQAQGLIRASQDTPLAVTLKRGDATLALTATPVPLKENSGRPSLGVGLARVGTLSYPAHIAILKGVEMTAAMGFAILTMLADAIRRLAFDGFVGPVGIAATTATVTKLGFSYLLNLIAQLSVSLAIFNILPIPALDGGRIFFALIERVRGRAMEASIENMIHVVGFALLMTLLLLVTFRDITRLISP